MTSRIFSFIFARGGSKGLPDKNILPFCGKPLLAHAILQAQAQSNVEKVFVSTDSKKIASVALTYGAEVINRPVELASDTASEWLAWQHAIQYTLDLYGQFDIFLSLPATAPLRSTTDIQNCIEAMNPDFDIVLTMTPSQRSPWFNMVSIDETRCLRLLNLSSDHQPITRRQDSPTCYDLTTVAYASRPKFILQHSSLWNGNVTGIKVPKSRSIDIDTQFDFSIAEFLMQNPGAFE